MNIIDTELLKMVSKKSNAEMAKEIEKLKEENKLLRECVEYIRDVTFIGESYEEIINILEGRARKTLAQIDSGNV